MSIDRFAKLKKALAIALTALQIPLLWFWKITFDAIDLESHTMEVTPGGGFALVFKWEKLGSAILMYLPVILSLLACLILSVLGMITILRKKKMGIPTVCFYAVTAVACGLLWYAFSRPYIIVGLDHVNFVELCEYNLFRTLGLPSADLFYRFRPIKFIVLGLHIAVSGALCGLGIVDLVRRKKAPPVTDDPLYEIKPL
ncbi:MAG: hypothetical protein II325_08655 [Clostridia bacterium]|nr:hypothetical protein [Clostridia bacterium]